MTTEQYNKSIALLISMIVANNAGGVKRALKEAGYNSTYDFVPPAELESVLFKIHGADRIKFFEILKKVDWNFGNNNWTNKPEYRDQIIKLVGQANGNTQLAKKDWWQSAIAFIQGTPPTTTVSTTETPARGVGFYIGMFFIAAAILATVWVAIKYIK